MRVLIADDHDLLRDTLVLYLAAEGGIETRAEADFAAAARVIEQGPPFDLVLLDVGMPGMNGLDGLRRAMALGGGQRVALISGTAPRELAQAALAEGAAGFLPKTLPARSLVNAVRFMAMGEQYAPLDFLHPAAPEAPAADGPAARLSPRERQVLKGLTEGKANKEIARDLGLQEPTVKLHVKTLCRKLGARNRTQAALLAREAGIG